MIENVDVVTAELKFVSDFLKKWFLKHFVVDQPISWSTTKYVV